MVLPSPGVWVDRPPADAAVLDRFFEDMRQERFDVAVQLHGGGRHSNPFVRRLGARLTVGLRAEDAPALDRTVPYRYFQHETLRFLEVAAQLGVRPGPPARPPSGSWPPACWTRSPPQSTARSSACRSVAWLGCWSAAGS